MEIILEENSIKFKSQKVYRFRLVKRKDRVRRGPFRISLNHNLKKNSPGKWENLAFQFLIVLMIKKQILIQGNEKNKEAIY